MENQTESNRALEELRGLSFSIWEKLRLNLSDESLMEAYILSLKACDKLQTEIKK